MFQVAAFRHHPSPRPVLQSTDPPKRAKQQGGGEPGGLSLLCPTEDFRGMMTVHDWTHQNNVVT